MTGKAEAYRIEPRSDTWIHVKRWAEARLAKASAAILSPYTDDRMTQYYRGEHLALVQLLGLADAQPEVSKRND